MRRPLAQANRRARRAALAVVAALTVANMALLRGVRLDDAYITFRYGQNLARGLGLVFNPGEHVLGTTAPGHAFLVAGVYRFAGLAGTPSIMAMLGALAWGVQAAVLLVWLWEAGGRRAVWALAGALPLACGFAASYRWIPLETNLAFAAALLSLREAARGRARTAGAFGAAACLLRPDNALALAIAAIVVHRRNAARSLIPFGLPAAIVGGAWVATATLYYGSPLPLTFAAKAHVSSIPEYCAHVAAWMPSDLLLMYTDGPLRWLLWALAIVGGGYLVQAGRGLWSLPALFAAHTGTYALLLRPNTAFGWHLYPDQALFAVFVALGSVESVRAFLRVSGALVSRESVAAGIVATALFSTLGVLGTFRFVRSYPHEYWYGERDAAYRRVAELLRVAVAPGEAVAAEEVGTLAYLTDARFYDFPGLVTPFSIRVDKLEEAKRDHGVAWLVAPTLLMPARLPVGSSIAGLREGRFSVRVVRLGAAWAPSPSNTASEHE
jgi:hypothetical protein